MLSGFDWRSDSDMALRGVTLNGSRCLVINWKYSYSA